MKPARLHQTDEPPSAAFTICTTLDARLRRKIPSKCRRSEQPTPGRVEPTARRFDETMGRARARMAAINRTADELAGLEDAERRRRMLDDLALELGG